MRDADAVVQPFQVTAIKWAAGIALAIGVLVGPAQPAGAVHLFPLTPTFDPIGHDCAKKLTSIPGGSPGAVQVVGFNFIDGTSRGSTTRVKAGQSVTWTWTLDNCHSVTFAAGGPAGTAGGDGFMPADQPQLVRWNGAGRSFGVTFPDAGTFSYFCVHHVSVGMTGTVVVEPAAAAVTTPATTGGAPTAPSAPAVLPRSGGSSSILGPSAMLLALALFVRRFGRARS